MNSRHNTENEVSNDSTCENEDSKNQEQTRLSNVELSVVESGSKYINDDNLLECSLFHRNSAMQHTETKMLEHEIEFFFDTMTLRRIDKG